MDREKYRREYYNSPVNLKKQPKVENKIGYIGTTIVLLVAITIIGYMIHNYKKKARLEESKLHIGQIWTEKIIQQSIYTLQPETLVVKKKIVNLEDNIVYYHQEEPETTYTFYQADYYTFKENSNKIKN
tara:strand:+ start:262 stop:648 length:387 start_codon:yes stop_codon:yes gene_type:complete